MVLSIGLLGISVCGKSQTAIAPKDLLTMAKGGSYEFTKSECRWLKNTCTDEIGRASCRERVSSPV